MCLCSCSCCQCHYYDQSGAVHNSKQMLLLLLYFSLYFQSSRDTSCLSFGLASMMKQLEPHGPLGSGQGPKAPKIIKHHAKGAAAGSANYSKPTSGPNSHCCLLPGPQPGPNRLSAGLLENPTACATFTVTSRRRVLPILTDY